MKYNLITTILLISFLSCNNRNELKNEIKIETNTVSTYKSILKDTKQIENLKKAIKDNGDISAFKELQEIYFNSGNKNEFLYYSLVMSNNYNCAEDFFSNYMILKTDVVNENNKINNYYANYYLLKAHELGYKHAINSISDRFVDKIPNSNEYWNLHISNKN